MVNFVSGAIDRAVAEHPVVALRALHEARELPEASAGVTKLRVLAYGHAGGVHPLTRDPSVRYRDCDPLLSGLLGGRGAPDVAPSPVSRNLRHLLLRPASAIEPPYTVAFVRVQAGGNLRQDQGPDFLEGVGSIHVVCNYPLYKRVAPVP